MKKNVRASVQHSPQLGNLIWSYHFITMLTVHGRAISILTIIDEQTQECLLSIASNRLTAQNVADELFGLFLRRGIPKNLFAFDDNDEMPKAICEWLDKLELNTTFVELKRYGENGYGALFKEKLIKNLFDEKSFASLAEVQQWLANWRNEHNRSLNLLRV